MWCSKMCIESFKTCPFFDNHDCVIPGGGTSDFFQCGSFDVNYRTILIAAILCEDLGNICVEDSEILVSLSFLGFYGGNDIDVLSVLDSLLYHLYLYLNN